MLDLEMDRGLMRLRVAGRIVESDIDAIAPQFEDVMQRAPDRVPMLLELGPDFAGESLAALWRDLKLDLRYRDKYGRIAVVGDKTWEKWLIRLSEPLFPGEMKFFSPARRAAAETWARSGAPG